MSPSRLAYLGLTGLALAFPVRRYVMWFAEHGLSWRGLIQAVSLNDATIGLATTMVVVSTAVIVFVIAESNARHDRFGLVAIPVTLVFGPGVGLPFYLFLRLRPLH